MTSGTGKRETFIFFICAGTKKNGGATIFILLPGYVIDCVGILVIFSEKNPLL